VLSSAKFPPQIELAAFGNVVSPGAIAGPSLPNPYTGADHPH
jgi:hypothetical protein